MTAVKVSQAIDRAASEWFVLEQMGEMTTTERRGLDEWLAANPLHAKAYEETRVLWSGLMGAESLQDVPSHEEEQTLTSVMPITRPRKARWHWLQVGAVAAVLLVFVTGYFQFYMSGAIRQAYTTGVGEIRTVELADGSKVTLGALSDLNVSFTDSERSVVLVGGEAFFDVEKDVSRPFSVAAGKVQVRVLGTRFDVRHGAQNVRVSVEDGAVEVGAANMREQTRVVGAGERITSSLAGDIGEVGAVSASSVAAWREGRLLYNNATLAEVVADAARYYKGTIEVPEPSILKLRVTTAFQADEIDTMINTLALGLPVEIKRPRANAIILLPKT